MNVVTEVSEYRGMVAISLDGSIALRVRKKHFVKRPLSVGDEVDFEDYQNTLAAVQFSDAYEAALTALDFCARTAKEIERSLIAKGFVPAVAASVVERLVENHLLDDKRFAERLAESNIKKPVGVYAMKRKLRAKGISDEDAESALESFSEEQQQAAASAAAQKLYRRYCDLSNREARGKLSQALARRGFGWEAISTAVNALFQEEFDEI